MSGSLTQLDVGVLSWKSEGNCRKIPGKIRSGRTAVPVSAGIGVGGNTWPMGSTGFSVLDDCWVIGSAESAPLPSAAEQA